MAHLDIYDLRWINVVFANRNQAYGAYQLRKENSRTLNKSLIIGSAIFILAVTSPQIIRYISGSESTHKTDIETTVILSQPATVDKKTPLPVTPAEPPKARNNQVKFPPPAVVPAKDVTDLPPTVVDLTVADPGQKTVAGDPSAPLAIDEPVGENNLQEAIVEDNSIKSFESVEVIPEYIGGMEKFYQYISKTYRYPALAQEKGVSGRIFLSFVIEKDGSLTDIKVLRDLGMGTGEEAIRVLKNSPKWKPGIQNGRSVRVAYTLPLNLNLEAQ